MGRPLSVLVSSIALASAALFLLLPMSKIDPPVVESESVQSTGESLPAIEQLPRITETVNQSPPDRQSEAVTTDQPVEATVAVNGRVENTSGDSLSAIEILYESTGFDGETITRSQAITDRFGEFSLQLVPARQYKLRIDASDSYAGYTVDGFTDSNAEGLQAIVLQRVEPVDLEGLIVDANLSPVADFELTLRHLTLEYPDRIIRSDSSGYFSLRGFPAGEIRIATTQSDYFRIKGLELKPGEYRNLTLIIDRGNYHLAGWVRNTDGTPLAEVVVTLRSAFATDEYHSFSYRSVATDSNGAFEFAGLGGHPLTLGVYGPGYATHIQQYDFISFSDNVEIVLERE